MAMLIITDKFSFITFLPTGQTPFPISKGGPHESIHSSFVPRIAEISKAELVWLLKPCHITATRQRWQTLNQFHVKYQKKCVSLLQSRGSLNHLNAGRPQCHKLLKSIKQPKRCQSSQHVLSVECHERTIHQLLVTNMKNLVNCRLIVTMAHRLSHGMNVAVVSIQSKARIFLLFADQLFTTTTLVQWDILWAMIVTYYIFDLPQVIAMNQSIQSFTFYLSRLQYIETGR